MNPNSPSPSRTKRSWLIPAVFAVVLFLGSFAANLVVEDVREPLATYMPFIWGIIVVALIVAVIAAIYDRSQRNDAAPPDTRETIKSRGQGKHEKLPVVTVTGATAQDKTVVFC